MSILVKGFVIVNSFVSNTPGQTSALGELSTWSRTYSKEKGEYQLADTPGFKLVTFKVIDDVTGVEQILSTNVARQAMQLVDSAISYAISHIRPYDSIDFKNTILTTFFQRVANLQIGNFIDNGTLALPEWISWVSIDNSDTIVKIWLADLAFQDQYDEFEIMVVPPIEPLNDFFNNYNAVVTEINARSSQQFSDQIQAIKGENPETYIRLLDFDFYNPLNLAQKTKCVWAVVVYSKVGDNIDSIKDAIVTYVLANSTHTRAEWEVILPDIFKRTEFTLLPRWDKISIPNLGNLSSLYSSVTDPKEVIAFAKNAIEFYDDAFIEDNVTVFPYDYKALTIVAVNGDTNTVDSQKLFDLYPDYIPEPSTSPDFNRMQLKTRDWMIFLQRLLIVAETANTYNSVPLYARKQYRNNLLFISGMFDNVNYLVAAKSNAIYTV